MTRSALVKKLLAPSILTLIGLLSLVESFKIRVLRFGGALGGDFVPKLTAAMVTALSALWLVDEFVKLRKSRSEESGGWNFRNVVPVVLFSAVFVGYIVGLRYLGFIISTFVLGFFNYFFLLDKKSSRLVFFGVFYSLGVTFLFWFLFEKVFNLPLPPFALW